MRNFLMLAFVLSAAAARADMIPRGRGDAVAVGKQLITAMGGNDAWQRARYFRFDRIGEREGMAPIVRSHYWDRRTGRYRVDGSVEEGAYRVYFNVNTRQGEAWLGGKKLTDAAQIKKWIDKGYEGFINDTQWLLAPFKIFDPGVTVEYDYQMLGPSHEICDVIALYFGNGALSPSDRYWLYVDRKSHLVTKWEYLLDGNPGRRSAWSWTDWQKRGPVMVASTRKNEEDPSVIRFDKITVSETPDDAALTPPK